MPVATKLLTFPLLPTFQTGRTIPRAPQQSNPSFSSPTENSASVRSKVPVLFLLITFLGAISQAWLYMGMAIRMATDLGMHRSADRWQRHGHILFTPSEKSSRKRIWHCAVILDRIMAFAMGRPMCIRERDYDTALPDQEEVSEGAFLFPVNRDLP